MYARRALRLVVGVVPGAEIFTVRVFANNRDEYDDEGRSVPMDKQ
jgi:hypothetical protein